MQVIRIQHSFSSITAFYFNQDITGAILYNLTSNIRKGQKITLWTLVEPSFVLLAHADTGIFSRLIEWEVISSLPHESRLLLQHLQYISGSKCLVQYLQAINLQIPLMVKDEDSREYTTRF